MSDLVETEAEIRTRYILPALKEAGWDTFQIREEYVLTQGRIVPRGRNVTRESRKVADYVLFHKHGMPLAVVEAKSRQHSPADGIQQALAYAELLDVPFAFSTNGNAFVFSDKSSGQMSETEIAMNQFPSPEELWNKYCDYLGLGQDAQKIAAQDYYDDDPDKSPRYYQQNAINRIVQKIAKGGKRALLVMATGTGKTYVAFQIVWRLWKAGAKKRILFLADRDSLVGQTKTNDFRPFGSVMSRLSTADKTINRDGDEIRVDPSYEIYLALYQSLTGKEDLQKTYRSFSRNFFDLIVVDECHRGSADEDSAWREILEYFSDAVQIGMTATPKETKYISNIDYFGEPVYEYSLKQGIADGFLAPYKVVKVHIDRDIEGYRPSPGDVDRDGEVIPDREYDRSDFDRTIVLDERTKIVAKRITEYLRDSGDRMQKTIVFCVDSEHAMRMRQALINENTDLCGENSKYIMRITSSDYDGVAQLDNFRDPEERYPVIATTARLLATGVDVPTCRIIVLDRVIRSMTEFKQIIGRGTRLHPDSNKMFFTILDFRDVTRLFADPDFDGTPVQVYEPTEDESMCPPDDPTPDKESESGGQVSPPEGVMPPPDEEPLQPIKKIYVDGVRVEILGERVQYLDENGDLITEDLRDYSRKCILKRYATLSEFLTQWKDADRRRAIMRELEEANLPLKDLSDMLDGDFGLFDLLCHVAYDRPPQTRRQRAAKARKSDVYTRYGEQARAILGALLDKYQNDGVELLDDMEMLGVRPLTEIGSRMEIINLFGGNEEYLAAVRGLQDALYADVA